jgi:hypothetical protein
MDQTVTEITFPSLAVVNQWSFDEGRIKAIVSLVLSPNDHFFVLLDSLGVGRCYSLAAGAFIA